jgi:hypothetical protein
VIVGGAVGGTKHAHKGRGAALASPHNSNSSERGHSIGICLNHPFGREYSVKILLPPPHCAFNLFSFFCVVGALPLITHRNDFFSKIITLTTYDSFIFYFGGSLLCSFCFFFGYEVFNFVSSFYWHIRNCIPVSSGFLSVLLSKINKAHMLRIDLD